MRAACITRAFLTHDPPPPPHFPTVGADCGELIESRSCANHQKCPVDCTLSAWTQGTPEKVSCDGVNPVGVGKRTDTRTVSGVTCLWHCFSPYSS